MGEVHDGRILEVLRDKFGKNAHRHEGVAWGEVEERIGSGAAALASLAKMEETGGEPDVIGRDASAGGILFCDCSAESPSGRRSLCYDRPARESRKERGPGGSAVEMAASMGIELLDEERYRWLQELGEFDLKTSSWVATPADIRARGGALFCDRRYGRVFAYHNGAESYYASRGFRGCLRV